MLWGAFIGFAIRHMYVDRVWQIYRYEGVNKELNVSPLIDDKNEIEMNQRSSVSDATRKPHNALGTPLVKKKTEPRKHCFHMN
jgi:hypothetical protein